MVAIERDQLSQRNTKILQAAFDEICELARVHQGWGPPMALFQTVPTHEQLRDNIGPRTYVYVSFGMDGEKPQGAPMGSADTFAEVLSTSIATFKAWLRPNRTLAWRAMPSADLSDDGKKWASYWRCIQIDDDARELNIMWNF